MTIYRPYFYIIRHIPTSKYYVGCKFGKDATPLNLMKPDGYHTSSNLVSNLIKEYGLDSFEICRIRVFDTAEQAYTYETRFLRRVHASGHGTTHQFSLDGNNKQNLTDLSRSDTQLNFLGQRTKDHM